MERMIIPHYKVVKTEIMLVFELMFPRYAFPGHPYLDDSNLTAEEQLRTILIHLCKEPEKIIRQFFDKTGTVKELLLKDAKFILDSDPAATGLQEVIAIYPGFFAIFCYRIAHSLSALGVELLPRMITEYAHRVTGIDIHPKALIGCPFAIDHGTGIVIGETSNIGHHVKMYQGVTLGALSVSKSLATLKRHPSIEDFVVLYAGCTILGGNTVIGKHSIIGGNVWLTSSIPPNSIVYHKSEISVRNQVPDADAINFVI